MARLWSSVWLTLWLLYWDWLSTSMEMVAHICRHTCHTASCSTTSSLGPTCTWVGWSHHCSRDHLAGWSRWWWSGSFSHHYRWLGTVSALYGYRSPTWWIGSRSKHHIITHLQLRSWFHRSWQGWSQPPAPIGCTSKHLLDGWPLFYPEGPRLSKQYSLRCSYHAWSCLIWVQTTHRLFLSSDILSIGRSSSVWILRPHSGSKSFQLLSSQLSRWLRCLQLSPKSQSQS